MDMILVQIPKHEKNQMYLYYFILFTGSLYSQYATGLSQPRNFSSWSCEIFVAIQLSEHKKQRSVGQLIRCKYLRSISSPKISNFKMFLSSTDVHLVISLIIIYWLGLSWCWWKSKWSLYQKQGESLKLSEIIFRSFFFLFLSFFLLPSFLPPSPSLFLFFFFYLICVLPISLSSNSRQLSILCHWSCDTFFSFVRYGVGIEYFKSYLLNPLSTVPTILKKTELKVTLFWGQNSCFQLGTESFKFKHGFELFCITLKVHCTTTWYLETKVFNQ